MSGAVADPMGAEDMLMTEMIISPAARARREKAREEKAGTRTGVLRACGTLEFTDSYNF